MSDYSTKRIILSGRVQGVGMRFFINRAATKFSVNGFVRNLFNGTVECVCQGDVEVLNSFIEYVKRSHPGHIEDMKVEDYSTRKEHNKFFVRYF